MKKSLVTTVTLNPAIDITYRLARFKPGSIHRVKETMKEPGGKGINVAKILHAFNVPVVATGLVGGNNGKSIESMLSSSSIHHDFEPVSEESRLCLNVLDHRSGSQTELLESGPFVSKEEFERFKYRLLELSQKSLMVIFSGSLPSGLNEKSYKELVHLVVQAGAMAVVDTGGSALCEAVKAGPFMIKPNVQEWCELTGRDGFNEEEIVQWLEEQCSSGIAYPFVSLGEKGMLAVVGGVRWKAVPPIVQSVNTVGCGDTFIGAFVAGKLGKMKFSDCLRQGIAAAAANALETKAGSLSLQTCKELMKQVTIIRNGKEYLE